MSGTTTIRAVAIVGISTLLAASIYALQIGCSGPGITGGVSASVAVTPPISVSPVSISVTPSQTQAFTATVSGASATALTWSLNPAVGSITAAGLYTAPSAMPPSAAVTITATSVSDPTNSASAAVTIVPPQAAGYSLAWQDTFSTMSLCSTNIVGCNWYDPGINGYSADGEITDPSNTYANLNWSSTQGSWYTNMSTASMNGASYRSWTPPFYIEVSMAFNAVTGNWPALWLRPVQTIGDPYVNGGELDIFEWFSYAPTQGTGSIHVWQNSVDTNNGGSNRWAIPDGTVLNNYNTYGVLVTGTSVSWYFNNSLVETFSTTSAPYNTVYAGQESYFLILSEQAGCGTGSGNCPDNTQTSPINMQVQWAHVFAGPLATH